MTQEEFKKQMLDIKAKELELYNLRVNAIEEFIKECAEFEVGELVTVEHPPFKNWKGEECVKPSEKAFVSAIWANETDFTIKYSLKKQLKNGKISNQGCYLWGNYKLIKI